jgi:hypothetical protein
VRNPHHAGALFEAGLEVRLSSGSDSIVSPICIRGPLSAPFI